MARFANCVHRGEHFVGVVDGDEVRPLQGIPPMSAGSDYAALAEALHGPAIGLSEVQLAPPVLAPGKVICLGLNYLDHVSETKRALPAYPVLFTKFADAIIGPHDPIGAIENEVVAEDAH
jgi:acylpyruvate hydrolase